MITVLVAVSLRVPFQTNTENSYVPGSRLFAGKITEAFGAITSRPPLCGCAPSLCNPELLVLLELHAAPVVALVQDQ